ncbi:MAG: helix-turn-helix domain-containing protein [Kofleriaceae bacterium]|nr:helix-turn-helix domain-containing protein [Kofleriaceae bacterium]MCL4223697.1 helix-turn-helix domain-containing protein [Myxococcales bacterium]
MVLSAAERRMLSSWSRLSGGTPAAVGLRARIILMAASGGASTDIADRLRTSPQTVCTWRARFIAQRLAALWTARDRATAGSGRRR